MTNFSKFVNLLFFYALIHYLYSNLFIHLVSGDLKNTFSKTTTTSLHKLPKGMYLNKNLFYFFLQKLEYFYLIIIIEYIPLFFQVNRMTE